MKITVNPSLEFELINPKGFDVKIIFKEDSKTYNGKWHLSNVTEIHNLYESVMGKKIAFESDILGTGRNNDVDDIESIEVLPNSNNEDFYVST